MYLSVYVGLYENGNSCTSVLPITRAWEQQELKLIKDRKYEEGKKRGVSVERSKASTKEKRSLDGPNYPVTIP